MNSFFTTCVPVPVRKVENHHLLINTYPGIRLEADPEAGGLTAGTPLGVTQYPRLTPEGLAAAPALEERPL